MNSRNMCRRRCNVTVKTGFTRNSILHERAYCLSLHKVSNNYFFKKVACMPLFSHAMENSEKNSEIAAFWLTGKSNRHSTLSKDVFL